MKIGCSNYNGLTSNDVSLLSCFEVCFDKIEPCIKAIENQDLCKCEVWFDLSYDGNKIVIKSWVKYQMKDDNRGHWLTLKSKPLSNEQVFFAFKNLTRALKRKRSDVWLLDFRCYFERYFIIKV